MSTNSRRFYDFGPFRVDESERLLRCGDEVVPLTPKAFEMLLVLVGSGGRVLTKEELMTRLWPDAVVEEANLSHNIYKLREALAERANNQKYIETVHRRGYRFLPQVTSASDSDFEILIQERSRAHILIEEDYGADQTSMPRAPARSLDSGNTRVTQPSPSKPLLAVGMLVVAIGMAAAAFHFWKVRQPTSVNPAPALHSIAVLPFKPLAANDRDESFELGMADTLITRLSSIGQLTVRPTGAVRQYNRLEDEAARAGRELMVDAVLDGSIQKSGGRVRVSVRLVRVDQDQTLWTEQFDEKLTDIFTVQDAISRRVADSLALRLTGEQRSQLSKRYTENGEAYQLYLRGRYHWNRRTAEGMTYAVNYFKQAIESDPSYAQAYAGLADSYSLLPEFSNAPFHDSMAKAKAASLKALELDDTLAEAHVSLAFAKVAEWDWAGVEAEYKRGLTLNPNYATGHQWYSEYLLFAGRTDEALKEIRLAQQLDPLSLIINSRVGITFYYARRYDEAIVSLRKTLEFDPNFILTHVFLYGCLFEKGMHRESIPHIVKGFFNVNTQDEKTRIEAALTSAYDAAGQHGLWEKVRDLMKGAEKKDYNYPYTMAETYMRLGDKDEAFFWLQKAMDVRHPAVAALRVEPAMDGLRSDPRFAELLRRMNL
jgi:TolB-like protein/DNA-binding winged helix-turn-helix (wHTH) protein/Tfp pilus assembly protein PilF